MEITAFSAGGRRAATCSPLKPPQEMPIMPTVPLHQGCFASQAMISSASSCSCFRYSSASRPSESPLPAMSTRAQRIAVGGEPVMRVVVARRACRRAGDRGCIRGSRARAAFGVARQQQPRRQLAPVRHRDPGDLDVLDHGAIVDRACFRLSCHSVLDLTAASYPTLKARQSAAGASVNRSGGGPAMRGFRKASHLGH